MKNAETNFVGNRNVEIKSPIWIIFGGIFVGEASNCTHTSWNENGTNDSAHKSILIHKSWKGYLFIFIKYAYLLNLFSHWLRPNNIRIRTQT